MDISFRNASCKLCYRLDDSILQTGIHRLYTYHMGFQAGKLQKGIQQVLNFQNFRKALLHELRCSSNVRLSVSASS